MILNLLLSAESQITVQGPLITPGFLTSESNVFVKMCHLSSDSAEHILSRMAENINCRQKTCAVRREKLVSTSVLIRPGQHGYKRVRMIAVNPQCSCTFFIVCRRYFWRKKYEQKCKYCYRFGWKKNCTD